MGKKNIGKQVERRKMDDKTKRELWEGEWTCVGEQGSS